MENPAVGETIRILLADDHGLFRQSLRFMLERRKGLCVVGEASDGTEAVEKARELLPDVVLMDVRMPNCSGLEALKQLRKDLPSIGVIMLTVSEADADLFAAVKAGARGYLLKTVDADELVRAVEQVSQGGAVVSPLMAAKLLDEFAAFEMEQPEDENPGAAHLTEREKQILEFVGQGLGNKEIAASLYIGENTVKTHLRNIMDKLHIHSRAQAAAYAIRLHSTSKRKARRGDPGSPTSVHETP